VGPREAHPAHAAPPAIRGYAVHAPLRGDVSNRRLQAAQGDRDADRATEAALCGAPPAGWRIRVQLARRPMRSPTSPTVDYPDPAVTTADRQVLGVDGVPPEDKLRTSPRVGSSGVVPAPADVPASVERRRGRRRPEPAVEDPICGVLGVRSDVLQRRCPTPTGPSL
jgi:hypothetical protein